MNNKAELVGSDLIGGLVGYSENSKILSSKFYGIIKSSKENTDDVRFANDKFTLISVGRMDIVKRFVCIPEIARKIKEQGCSFRWYIIGAGGTEEEKVRSEIEKNGVSEQVVMLGAKNNPYSYIARADVLVCPSITEACPNVVNEAKILHVPVVAADFPSAPEYIENKVNGIISPIDRIADEVVELYNNEEFYAKIKTAISGFEYLNDGIRQQLDDLFMN